MSIHENMRDKREPKEEPRFRDAAPMLKGDESDTEWVEYKRQERKGHPLGGLGQGSIKSSGHENDTMMRNENRLTEKEQGKSSK